MDDRKRGGGREVVFISEETWTSQETTCKTSRKTTGAAAGSRTVKTTGKAHEILVLKVLFILEHLLGFLPLPLSPPSECATLAFVAGGEHTRGGEGGGGSIFWKTQDTALYSTYIYRILFGSRNSNFDKESRVPVSIN